MVKITVHYSGPALSIEAIFGAESIAYVRGHLLTPDTQSLITNLLRRFTAFTTKTLIQRLRLVHAL